MKSKKIAKLVKELNNLNTEQMQEKTKTNNILMIPLLFGAGAWLGITIHQFYLSHNLTKGALETILGNILMITGIASGILGMITFCFAIYFLIKEAGIKQKNLILKNKIKSDLKILCNKREYEEFSRMLF